MIKAATADFLTHLCSNIAKIFHLFQAEYEENEISLQLILKIVSLNWNQSMLLVSCAIQKTEAEVGKLITDRIRQIISLGEEK